MLFVARWTLLLRLLVQPGIGQNGVVNKASRIPPTLASGILARGAAFSIRGVHFASAATVSIRKGGVSTKVQVVALTPEHIEAVVPDAAPLGLAAIVVTASGSESKPFPVKIAASNPGIFSVSRRGWGPGQIEVLDTAGKRTLNSTSNPARPGERVVMRITGLAKGTEAPLVIGNRTVQSGPPRSLPAPGEQEVSFVIPQGVPMGCYVPIYFRPVQERTSNVVTIAISASPGNCDPGPIPLLDKQRIGLAMFTRTDMLKDDASTTSDEVIALFIAKESGPALSPLRLLPPPGTCTAYMSSFQEGTIMPDSIAAALISEVGGTGLTAGRELLGVRGKYRRVIPSDPGLAGYYRAGLGSFRTKWRPLFLEPGNFVLSAKGGTDVGAFNITAESPLPFEWTDRSPTKQVFRNQPLTLSWRGLAPGQITVILATNVDQVTTAIGTCLCTAPLSGNRFEVPAALLANIPASTPVSGIPYDQLFIASLPRKGAVPLKTSGIDSGAVFTVFANGRFVQYH